MGPGVPAPISQSSFQSQSFKALEQSSLDNISPPASTSSSTIQPSSSSANRNHWTPQPFFPPPYPPHASNSVAYQVIQEEDQNNSLSIPKSSIHQPRVTHNHHFQQQNQQQQPSSILKPQRSRSNLSHALASANASDLNQEYRPPLVKSSIADWTSFFSSLEHELIFPVPSIPESYTTPVSDACLLSCGCIMSEAIASEYYKKDSPQNTSTTEPIESATASIQTISIKTDSSSLSSINISLNQCLICKSSDTYILKPLENLRSIYAKIDSTKKSVGIKLLSTPETPENTAKPLRSPSSLFPVQQASHSFPASFDTPLDHEATNVDLSSILIDYSVEESSRIYSKKLLKTFVNTTSSLPNDKLSLLDIFRSAVVSVQRHPLNEQNPSFYTASTRRLSPVSTNTSNSIDDASLHSSLTPDELAIYKRMSESIGGLRMPQILLQQHEKYYSKCFPTYRKEFQHNINSWFSLSRSKSYVSTYISPDATKFVVLSEKKWSVYKIPIDFNESPILLFSGKSTGEVTSASSFSNEKNNSKKHSASSAPRKSSDSGNQPDSNEENLNQEEFLFESEKEDLETWNMQIASLSNRYLAISGTNGILRVYDLERNAKAIYHYKSKYFTRYMVISPSGRFITCVTTGIDKGLNNKRVPMVALHWLPLGDFCPQMVYYTTPNFDKSKVPSRVLQDPSNRFEKAETINIEIPYNDEISVLSISADDCFICCATRETSHILIINITDPHQPRLCQKLSRRSTMDDNSEGITCLQFHPGNQLLSVTSAAPKAYPMIITTDLPTNQTHPSSGGNGIMGNSIEGGNGSINGGDINTNNGNGGGLLADTNINNGYPSFNNSNPGMYPRTGILSTSSTAPSLYSSATGGSKLKVLMRVEKVGTMIHKAEISPRQNMFSRAGAGGGNGNNSNGTGSASGGASGSLLGAGISVAYLDKNGLVYLMHSLDKSHKRIMVLTEVAAAPNYKSAASLRFTPTGHALFVLDRKGNFHIQDFAAGYPQQAGISKCRILG